MRDLTHDERTQEHSYAVDGLEEAHCGGAAGCGYVINAKAEKECAEDGCAYASYNLDGE